MSEPKYPNLWQSPARVSGSVCIKGTRMPIWEIGNRVIPLIEAIPQAQWDEEIDDKDYTKQSFIESLRYMQHFFWAVRLDLSDPVVMLSLELLTRRCFTNPTPITDEAPVPDLPQDNPLHGLVLAPYVERFVALLQEMNGSIRELSHMREQTRIYEVEGKEYSHEEYLVWRENNPDSTSLVISSYPDSPNFIKMGEAK